MNHHSRNHPAEIRSTQKSAGDIRREICDHVGASKDGMKLVDLVYAVGGNPDRLASALRYLKDKQVITCGNLNFDLLRAQAGQAICNSQKNNVTSQASFYNALVQRAELENSDAPPRDTLANLRIKQIFVGALAK